MNYGVIQLDSQDLDDILLGAQYLAAGGGEATVAEGVIKQAKQLLQQKSSASQTIRCIRAEDVSDEAWLTVLSSFGCQAQKLAQGFGKSPLSAFLAHERQLQIKLDNPALRFSALVPSQTDPLSLAITLLVAAILDLAVVDGAGAATSVPGLQMLSFANPAVAVCLSPALLASEEAAHQGGATLDIDCKTASTVDTLAKAAVAAQAGFYGRATLAAFAMQGRQLKQPSAMLGETLSRALHMGRSLRNGLNNPSAVVVADPASKLVLQAEIEAVELVTTAPQGFVKVSLRGQDGRDYLLITEQQNLLLCESVSQTPLVMAPDAIFLLAKQGQQLLPISSARLLTHFAKPAAKPISVAVFAQRANPALCNQWFHKQYGELLAGCGYSGGYIPSPLFLDDPQCTPLAKACGA